MFSGRHINQSQLSQIYQKVLQNNQAVRQFKMRHPQQLPNILTPDQPLQRYAQNYLHSPQTTQKLNYRSSFYQIKFPQSSLHDKPKAKGHSVQLNRQKSPRTYQLPILASKKTIGSFNTIQPSQTSYQQQQMLTITKAALTQQPHPMQSNTHQMIEQFRPRNNAKDDNKNRFKQYRRQVSFRWRGDRLGPWQEGFEEGLDELETPDQRIRK